MKRKYLIGEMVDEEGRMPLRPVRPVKLYNTYEEARSAIENMCFYNGKKVWEFGVIEKG